MDCFAARPMTGSAKRSIARAVIASEAKQSILPRKERMDCFAPLAMTENRNLQMWTYPAKNGPDRAHGRSDFPAEPTRVDGRIRRRGARSGDIANGCRPGAPLADASGQGRRHRLASGRAGDADMVARQTSTRPRYHLQAWRHA